MSQPRRLRRSAAAAAATLTLFLASAPAVANTDSSTTDYPTWAEVEAAKQSEAQSAATYDRLEHALGDAQAEAATAGAAAVEAGIVVHEATQDLQLANNREESIASRLEQAESELSDNSDALGRTVAWLYRDGTGLARYSELASAESADEFMAKLSVATQVTGTWNALADRSAQQVNTITGLREQAEEARVERVALAEAADDAARAAADAQASADAAVSTAQERTDTVYAQLAALRGTTAEVEKQYQLGIQVAAQAEARERERQQEAAREAARQIERDSGGGGGGGNPSNPTPPTQPAPPTNPGNPGVITDPAAARAYAREAIGAYGWGSSQYTCLVDLWHGESGWRYNATNPWSGAYGIPQSWPAEKLAAAGPDWRTNAVTQINWGLAYIDAAYGSPCTAWNRWLSRNPHWY